MKLEIILVRFTTTKTVWKVNRQNSYNKSYQCLFFYLPHLSHWSLTTSPENIKKSLAFFLCTQGLEKNTSGKKWVKQLFDKEVNKFLQSNNFQTISTKIKKALKIVIH